jgi:single-strand DNA-binding protein
MASNEASVKPAAPAPAPKASTGFDDMDDDIPF